jgi:hypothetical protein
MPPRKERRSGLTDPVKLGHAAGEVAPTLIGDPPVGNGRRGQGGERALRASVQ